MDDTCAQSVHALHKISDVQLKFFQQHPIHARVAPLQSIAQEKRINIKPAKFQDGLE